jgi:glutamyl-tRNA synthetase
MNSQYIMNSSSGKLSELVRPYLIGENIIKEDQVLDPVWFSKAVRTLQERAKTLVELANSLRYYIAEDIVYNDKAKEKFLTAQSRELLKELENELFSLADFSHSELERVFKAVTEKNGVKLGALAQPVRVAMTGGTESPGIFDVIEVLGKEKTLKRLEKAIAAIGEQ